MSDSVAARSGFLCGYMSNHPDTLAAYITHFGHVSSPISTPKMTSINCKAMTLSYTVKGSDKTETVHVEFDPPLIGYDEVKPRLLSMKLDAEESLGMVKRPKITRFVFPMRAFMTIIPLSLLIAQTLAADDTHLGNLRDLTGGWSTIKFAWNVVAVLHSAEALWVGTLCNRHQTGFSLGAAWTLSTFALGFPMWFELRKLIQVARIDSIAKVH